MEWSTETKVRLGFGVALACVLVSGVAALWAATRSIDSYYAVEHSEQVKDQLVRILGGMVDVETGARGFALTGRAEFLQPYNTGHAKAINALQQLTAAIADNPEEQADIGKLESLSARRFDEAARLIDIRKSEGLEGAMTATSNGAGKEIMDSIRDQVSAMQEAEGRLLNQRSAEAQATFRVTLWIVAVGSAIAVGVVGFAGVRVRKDFERRRNAEEERDRFFDLSPDLFCFAAFDGYFKKLNPAWESVLGFSRAELLARPFVEWVHPDDRSRTAAAAEKLAQGEEIIRFENRYRTKDGSYRWFSWNARSIAREGLIYAGARDVTEQKQTEEKIRKLNRELEAGAAELRETNQELEAFSYSVSHDLRAPLRHIDGFVDLLNKSIGKTLDEKNQRYLQTVAASARQMGMLIDDLLVFSRMSRAEMRQTKVHLEELTKEIIRSVREEAPERCIAWKNGNLPDVNGDRPMLRQAMLNLIANAVKYTRPRSRAEIEIGSVEKPDETVIFVRDNGVGFDMEYVHKLFGVFQRLHRAEEFEGTGIGLANVRRIIQRHGGRTWAEGKVDGGATFYFSLPKKQNHDA